MKRSLVSLLMLAFFGAGLVACAERPAARMSPVVDARAMDFADQYGGPVKPAGPPKSKIDTAAAGKGEPADALKLILLQLLVGR